MIECSRLGAKGSGVNGARTEVRSQLGVASNLSRGKLGRASVID